MATGRFFRRFHGKPLGVALAANVVLALASASAHADGQPLILDTQGGISDGQAGTVLQNAPLSSQPMVQMQQLPTLNGSGTDGSQVPIIVSPYVEVPGGGGRPPKPMPRPMPMPLQSAPAQ
jgi:hypothetical protein